MPLRVTLLVIVLVISAVGLTVSAAAVGTLMRDYSYAQIDRQLTEAMGSWAGRNLPRPNPNVARPPSDFYVQKIYGDGTSLVFNDHDSAPDIRAITVADTPVTVAAVHASGDQSDWRAIVSKQGPVVTVVAVSLKSSHRLLVWLTLLQLLIGLVVLLVLGFISWFVIKRALRPLCEVEQTAVAIAGGDLDRRVPSWPANTEVGHLAQSLNIMLGRLQDSITTARDKEEQMRRFVGDASHELRTPLTSVRGFAELYRSGATTDADYVLGRVEGESQRMSLLVEDLLALTRAEGSPMEITDCDPCQIARTVVSSLKAAHPERILRLHIDGDGDGDGERIPDMAADAARINQVLTNLVNNALVHAGPAAEVEVTVSASQGDVVFTVADNGCGMGQADVDHIFERFYRVDTSRSRDHHPAGSGSGLGLAIARSLVLAHKGSIRVDSRLGEGTVFTVTIPGAAAHGTGVQNNR
ncbi:HAMP domain-containing histidine kinase [Corynebacterium sp. CCM 8862]|uniref:histidine kinase n=1 Tax=Corynebacterium mendelii TaxID=2765362 RepID=A0A939E260_9CORY|nr:HAMP domain-containing histidine kinase [Corynebacterium mendelii]